MAESLILFGVQKLWDLLVQESNRFKGVDEQLTELKSDLNLLRSFLKDADAKKHASALVRNCVEEIKEIVFDAEDIIETVLLKEELRNGRRLSSMDLREVAIEMEGISKRISMVIRDRQSFGVQQLIVDGGGSSNPLQERQREMRHTFPNDNESNFVGLEKNVKKLVGYLVEEESIQVVSICGMGGIGKTALARQVFNHETVKNHFDGFAWVCVTQQFTRKYVWQRILRHLSSEHDAHRVLEMTEDKLQENVFKLLETSNSLIVLDDMWKEEDWDMIKPVFPRTKGWKILLTSRKEVALFDDPACIIFKQECLTPEESWTLFGRIAFPPTSESQVDEEMVKMGKEMIKHCGGLPLAVKVLGGLLAADYTLPGWIRINENFGSYNVGGTSFNDIYHILSLSYEDLPNDLKNCFLYLAHFPEDFSIDVEDLTYYWAAEGIISRPTYDGVSIREVTDAYIEELVRRNMIVSERDKKSLRFERIRWHDMTRKACLLRVQETNFVQIVDASTGSSTENSQSRRLVIQSSDHTFQMDRYIQNPRLRSLLFIKHTWGANWKASSLFFTRLQLMRVLDLTRSEFEGEMLPYNIGKLIHLRYLSLYMAKVSRLPSSMRNLKQLIYLNLCVGSISPIYLSNFLEEMRRLIHLFLPDDMQDKTKLKLGNLINLETLENFSTKHCSVTDLQNMTRLRIVSVIFNGQGCHMEDLSSTLGELKHLEKLTIGNKRVSGVQVMGKGPLVDQVGSGEKSFSGKRMVCSSGGFLKLRKLELNGLAQLEEWIVEEGSMPLLHTLNVNSCRKLKELPDGLRFISSLKELAIITRERGFKEKLSRWGDDYYKVRHIPHLTISEIDMNSSHEECHNTDIRVFEI